MTPHERLAADIEQYWFWHNRLRRSTVALRLILGFATPAMLGVAAICFWAALHSTRPLWQTILIADTALDITMAIYFVTKWPPWPQPDAAILDLQSLLDQHPQEPPTP